MPPVSTVRPLNPKTKPVNVASPVPVSKVNDFSPSIDPENKISPPPEPVPSSASPDNVNPEAKLMSSDDVLISPAIDTEPSPSCVNLPSRFMSPVEAMVKRPEFVISAKPPFFVTTAPLISTVFDVISRPSSSTDTVLSNPRPPAETTFKPLNGVEPPAAPSNLISPVPAVNDNK